MAFGRQNPGAGSEPLFAIYFAGATFLNLVPALSLRPLPIEVAVIGAAHGLFLARLVYARHRAGRQRTLDLECFRRLREGPRG